MLVKRWHPTSSDMHENLHRDSAEVVPRSAVNIYGSAESDRPKKNYFSWRMYIYTELYNGRGAGEMVSKNSISACPIYTIFGIRVVLR